MTTTAPGGGLLQPHYMPLLQDAFRGELGETTHNIGRQRFVRWWRTCLARLGPAASARTIAEDRGAAMFAIFGFALLDVAFDVRRGVVTARAAAANGVHLPVLIAPWGENLDRRWAQAVREGVAASVPWTICWNVQQLRIVDAQRPWGRRHVTFDLARCAADPDAFAILWALARADAFAPHGTRRVALSRAPGDSAAAARHAEHSASGRQRGARRRTGVALGSAVPSRTLSLLDHVIEAAARQAQSVSSGLERGVAAALVVLAAALLQSSPHRARPTGDQLFQQCLTVLYRLLFLLFAEARALVPMWHRTYREAYSVESLRGIIERDASARGLWPALQAIARLLHRGCRVGTLHVTPFNGHLFAPEHAPLVQHARVDDQVLRLVIESVTVVSGRRGRQLISFADLGVEQLGAIYERVLDHRLVVDEPAEAAIAAGPRLRAPRGNRRPMVRLMAGAGARKASATYYTPRPLTELIVRRTLSTLVSGATSEQILRLRVVDPAMGSGAFLVACCRYLAAAYETAVAREQQLRDHEIGESDRATFRRLIARRCLYGVDRNPMAVQLARLSLWLATLAADVPLTFLDHHLREGDSLVGASLSDLLRQAPAGARRRRRLTTAEALPLLASTDAFDSMRSALPVRREIEDEDDDRIEHVRNKERLLASLHARGAPLERWRRAADIWCSSWFWSVDAPSPSGPWYRELLAEALGRPTSVAASTLEPAVRAVGETARRERFFHWAFEFPEVFSEAADGSAPAGFDAVVGNPPWDMIRSDERAALGTSGERRVSQLSSFIRDSGIYARPGGAHVNLYLLFVERALQLLKPGGRLGMVVPWGFAIDHGAAGVRRQLLDASRVDTWLAIDNRKGLFPIHRSLRLLVVAGTKGTATRSVPLAHCEGSGQALDRVAEAPVGDRSLALSRDLLERMTAGALAVPELREAAGLRLLDTLTRSAPPLGAAAGWNARFGRELNATDDRVLLSSAGPGLPVLDGKHVEPFHCHVKRSERFITRERATRRFPSQPFTRARVAYRDVASATNQRTLIAAVVPRGTVTTHTLFCCRTPLEVRTQWMLCALLNSFVANWFVRRWVSSHVTVQLIERLPVPLPSNPHLDAVPALARTCAHAASQGIRLDAEARLHAHVARAYGLSRADLELVLDDFPLVETRLRQSTLNRFEQCA